MKASDPHRFGHDCKPKRGLVACHISVTRYFGFICEREECDFFNSIKKPRIANVYNSSVTKTVLLIKKKIKSRNKESFSQKDGYFRKERSVYKIGNTNYGILQTQYMNSVYKIVNT